MFKIGDRVKPIEPDSVFSAGVVVSVYAEDDFFSLCTNVKLDVISPAGYSNGSNPTLVLTTWFELE